MQSAAGRFTPCRSLRPGLALLRAPEPRAVHRAGIGVATVGSSAVMGVVLMRRVVPDEPSILSQLVFGADARDWHGLGTHALARDAAGGVGDLKSVSD